MTGAPRKEHKDGRTCPVCVFTATNVSADVLLGVECFNCGGDLGDHAVERRKSVAPGKAYAVNRDALNRWPLEDD